MPPTSASLDSLKQQLARVDDLVAQGVLKGEAARKARDALERQVLAHVLAPGEAVAPPPAPRPPRALVAVVAAFVLVFGVAGYAWLGNRAGLAVGPGENVAVATDEGSSAGVTEAQIEAMVARLAERLKTQPDDVQGWSMLARSYTAQGKYTQALEGYKRVLELRPKDAQAMVDYADALAMVNNRSLDGEPEKLVMAAVKIDPANVKALALAGTIAFNRGEFPGAVGYWERAVQASDPAGDFGKQLQGALDEARKRAGMPAVAAAAPAAPAAPAAQTAPAAGAAAVAGRVSLKDAVRSRVAPDDTVFIFARAASGSRMPLAILRKKVSDLPLDFTLDDSLAMSPATRLSTAPQVVVGARVSKSGNAMPQPGDWQALSAPVALGTRGMVIEIGDAVP